MSDGSHIEWTDATWNPITGCTVHSPGCTNCYAMKLAGTRLQHHPSRAGLTRQTKAGPVWTGEVRFNEDWLTQPLKWKRPRRIFVCAHADLFHESVPDEWIDRVFAVMALAPQHQFQVLTKRSARMREYFTALNDRSDPFAKACDEIADALGMAGHPAVLEPCDFPLPNVWLGVSVEDQTRADERIPDLLATPAAVRWISAEPLLGPVDVRQWLHDYGCSACGYGGPVDERCRECGWHGSSHHQASPCPECGEQLQDDYACPECGEPDGEGDFGPTISGRRLGLIDWVIVGGESGAGARPMHPDWARSLRDQCAAAGVPFLFKQWGEWAPVYEMSEELIDSICHPVPEHAPDATRRCKVDQCVLHGSGDRFDGQAMFRRPAFEQGSRAMTMFSVGKSRAGRLLDGVQHDGYPA